jgi:YbgC/YbaW family acyl-CoA thioester hydrolase
MELRGSVRWADADPAGFIYYPRIFDYVGECEWKLLHGVGLAWKDLKDAYSLPRVHVECDYRKVMWVGEAFTVKLRVAELGRTSIRYAFEVFLDSSPAEAAACGSVTSVVVVGGKPFPIPDDVRAALSS